MNRREFFRQGSGMAALAVLATSDAPAFAAADYDVVILDGRVMDPETGLDATRSLGIRNGLIAAISRGRLRGRVTIDARGLVVAPGFIDPLAHGMNLENNRIQALDGVTTVLALEGETADVDAWYAGRKGKMLLNYGASVGHGAARSVVMGKGSDTEYRAATDVEIAAIRRLMEQGLKRGALAAGFGIEYTPGATHWEILEMFHGAARYGAPCHVHIRYGNLTEPGSAIEGAEEVISASYLSGAPLHIVHVTSMGLRDTPALLRMIGEARNRGLDLTCCCYPYTAFGTGISSAVFDEGWQKKFGIGYGDLQWAATGERLTEESFARYRKTGGMVIAHAIPEAAVLAAVSSPLTMICTDGSLDHGKGHPRSTGTHARVLGRYVREQRALSLMEAIKKMTLMPARRMERHAPAMKNKGRIRTGADADIAVFNPEKIIDRATYNEPALTSEGVSALLVNGIPVVLAGKLQEPSALPGRPVRAPLNPTG